MVWKQPQLAARALLISIWQRAGTPRLNLDSVLLGVCPDVLFGEPGNQTSILAVSFSFRMTPKPKIPT